MQISIPTLMSISSILAKPLHSRYNQNTKYPLSHSEIIRNYHDTNKLAYSDYIPYEFDRNRNNVCHSNNDCDNSQSRCCSSAGYCHYTYEGFCNL